MSPPAAAAAPAVSPRPRVAPGRRTSPQRPRRVSGPARPGSVARPAQLPSQAGGIALGVLGALDGLARHRRLDRVLRGRTSIALVAFALIGIVTLQLGLLKLNSSIGRTLERESLLQRQNAALSIENSELTAGERVESRATQLGMQLVPVASLRFLSARPSSDAGRAAAAVRKAPAQGTSGEATQAGTGSSAGAATSTSESEQALSASSAPSSEASSGAGTEAQPPSESSSHPTGSPAPATGAPSGGESPSGAPSSSSSAEAGPGGGTQAAPTG